MKKIWEKPNILLGIEPGGDEEDTGGGTGQSGQAIFPCSFEEWEIMYFEDMDGDDDFDFDDYRAWWDKMGFSETDWYEYNETPFNP